MSSFKHLPRRTFLKGLGVSMALPMLEAMKPAAALAVDAAAKTAPTRAAFIFFANGAIMPSWTPTEAGENYTLSKSLKPLEALKGKINVMSGLAQDNGRAKGDGPGDHARCASTYLTGAHPFKTDGANIKVGISVDQQAASKIGNFTKLPSLELGIERGRTAGNCDSGYSCAYSSAISWKTPTTPMAKEIVPRLAFERLFGSEDKGQKQRNRYRKSILDLVSAQASDLKVRLSKTDRRKIDEYFNSVSELEKQIVRAEATAKEGRPDFQAPEGVPADLQQHIRLMYDLMALAFQTDTTRVATFMLGNAGSNRAYKMAGVNSGHHAISHHRNEEEKIADLQKIDEFLVTQFAYFLEKMESIKEGDQSLLDNSMIVYGSGLGDANRHLHHELPVVFAGGGGGTIKTGSHIKYESETPLNNLFLSMLDRLNVTEESFGDGNGRLKELNV